MFDSYNDLVRSLNRAGLESVAPILLLKARRHVRLESFTVKADDELPIGTSKIGGAPDWPRGAGWPIRPPYADGPVRTLRDLKSHKNRLADWLSWEGSKDHPAKTTLIQSDIASTEAMLRQIAGPFPLSFVAQVNLADAHATGTLDPRFPATGLLSYFQDIWEDPFGAEYRDKPGFQVFWHDTTARDLVRLAMPEALQSHRLYLAPAGLRCQAAIDIPRHGWPSSIPEDAIEKLLDLFQSRSSAYDGNVWHELPGSMHRLGGWPIVIQSDMEIECEIASNGGDATGPYRASDDDIAKATADWVHVLQIGSDENSRFGWSEEPGLYFGDGGKMYVWLRASDLAERRFENCWVMKQCY